MAKFSIQAVKGFETNIDTYEEEPVSVAQLKNYLQIEGTAYDSTLANFITSARMQIERYCNVSLVPHSIRAQIRNNPAMKPFPLPYPPIASVEQVAWQRCPSTKVLQDYDSEWYFVDDQADAKEILARKGGLFFVDYTTAASTEVIWQQAILAQCGFMYNNRDADKPVRFALSPETMGLVGELRNHYY